MKKLLRNTIAISMIATAGLSFSACGNGDTVSTVIIQESIRVETITPEISSIIVMGEYIGTVEPNQQVSVLPRIPGEVLSVYFNVGDRVQAGDILFTIDPTEIQNNITALEAQLAVQDATVRTAQTGVNLVDGSTMQSQLLQASGGINQAEAAIRQAEQNIEQSIIGVEQAQLGYDMAAQAYNDTAVLFEAGVVARVAYEQAEAGYANALAALERAQSGYALAQIALSQAHTALQQAIEGQRILAEDAPAENRRRAQDALAQAQAARHTILVNIDVAMDRLEDAIVTAPISGIIEARDVDEFSMASPQSSAFTIAAQDVMTVAFRVPRNSFEHLAIGDEITLVDNNIEQSGIITEISATVDAGGLIAVRANIPNPPASLLGGTTVRIFAEAQRAQSVLTVPLSAVHYDRGVPYVYINENGTARRIQVEVGIFDANVIQIISGISNTDHIINTWSARLADGVTIEVAGA